ncbi:HNH endonuclease signature motif containing protein [Erysipelothrix anatis]|uniref:HNH endonuclease signature motif containing protein n=1 Tax=Erysipelothrix anatis TaxID=2683713 RepID=UPI00135A7A15|nr:HNH endonuclease signature motif containing protein [Erysipelothrix anatis]
MKKNKYTEEHIQFVKDNAHGISTKKMAEMFSEKFGIEMTTNKMKSLKGNHKISSGITGYFEKGHCTHNKGKKWSEYMTEESQINSKKTTFRKGSIPPNRRELGDERIVDGYHYRKVADNRGNNNWKLIHHIIWESQNGPIPNGCVVIFLNSDKSDLRIENLQLISRSTAAMMTVRDYFTDQSELTSIAAVASELEVEINKKMVVRILQDFEDGKSNKYVSEKYGYSPEFVRSIKSRYKNQKVKTIKK